MEHSNCKCIVIIIGSDRGRKYTALELLEDLEVDTLPDYLYVAYMVNNYMECTNITLIANILSETFV